MWLGEEGREGDVEGKVGDWLGGKEKVQSGWERRESLWMGGKGRKGEGCRGKTRGAKRRKGKVGKRGK